MDRELAASNRGKPRWDSLEVSLHDVDLAQEVELLSYLMVAANETEHRLAQCDVDRILGVTTNGGPDGVQGDGVAAGNSAGGLDRGRSLGDDLAPDGESPVVPVQRRSSG